MHTKIAENEVPSLFIIDINRRKRHFSPTQPAVARTIICEYRSSTNVPDFSRSVEGGFLKL